MRRRTLAYPFVLLALLAGAMASGAASAQSADWQPNLEPPRNPPNRGPQEPFVIRLSAPYDASSGRLALELDNVDVTSRVRPLDTSYTVFELAPYAPMSRGSHVLRMVEYANDGSIVERGRWTFVVQVVESAFDSRVNTSASYRFDESPADLAWPGRTQAQGSMLFDAYTDNGARRYAAIGALLIDTNTPAGVVDAPDNVDLGDFLLSFDTRNVNVSAGHHVPGVAQGVAAGNLIYDGYPRRGLSGTVRSDAGTASITGYTLRTENIRGFEHGLGVGDPANRIAGASFRIQPADNVAVGVGFVDGEGSDAGFATGVSGTPLDGRASNVALDTLWLERRLSVRAEAAVSKVELGESFGDVSDQAYLAAMTWQPHQGLKLGERFIPWNLNLNYARIGAGFRSIANLQQVANVEEIRAGFNAYHAGVSLALAGARVEDNLESDLYPSTRSDNVNVSLSWTPAVDADFGGVLFARPTLGLNLLGDWRETARMPPASLALPTDLDTRGYTTFASFGHPYGSWTVTLGSTEIEDHTDVMPDQRYRSAGLSTSFQIGDRYSITPGVQYDVARDRDSGIERRSTNASLSQNWVLIADRLYWNLALGYNGNRLSDATSDQRQSFANTTLSWRQGLFTLWLQGAWSDIDNETFDMFSGVTSAFSRDQYQVLLGVSLNWPDQAGAGTSPAAAAGGGMY